MGIREIREKIWDIEDEIKIRLTRDIKRELESGLCVYVIIFICVLLPLFAIWALFDIMGMPYRIPPGSEVYELSIPYLDLLARFSPYISIFVGLATASMALAIFIQIFIQKRQVDIMAQQIKYFTPRAEIWKFKSADAYIELSKNLTDYTKAEFKKEGVNRIHVELIGHNVSQIPIRIEKAEIIRPKLKSTSKFYIGSSKNGFIDIKEFKYPDISVSFKFSKPIRIARLKNIRIVLVGRFTCEPSDPVSLSFWVEYPDEQGVSQRIKYDEAYQEVSPQGASQKKP